ncbi:MAG: hypothetical protein QXF52_05815 [Thermoproteota archaeon]
MSIMKICPYLLALTVMILVGAVSIMIFSFQKERGKIMELTVSGGFWARMERFECYANGSVVFKDLARNLENTMMIPCQLLDELTDRMTLLLKAYPEGLKLEPTGGADYFIYNLNIYSNGKTVTYYWTDVSEEFPNELSYFISLLRGASSFASGYWDIMFYLKTDKLIVNRGETLKIFPTAMNPAQKNFSYVSPTPCSPDFKLYLQTSGGRRVELFPTDYDPPCIQVIQNRTLNSGNMIQSEYNYTFEKSGIYIIEAYFPYAEWSETRYVCTLTISVQ